MSCAFALLSLPQSILVAAATVTAVATVGAGAVRLEEVPGTVVFHGRYKHRNTGREIGQPSELWIKRTADGAITALAQVPFMNSTEIAAADAAGRFRSHELLGQAGPDRPDVQVKLEFDDGKALLTRHGLRQDCDRKELKVPSGALFDPNTRPDAYCAANLLLRAFVAKQGQEWQVFDWDNSGEGLVPYMIGLTDAGPERVEVPAGVFNAKHYVLTQKTSADTWFKKRAGHTTDFWVLDNGVIVRLRRNREPYEMVLLDYTVPAKLPGQVSESSAGAPPSNSAQTNAAAPGGSYAADWTALVREVDQNYPFFELKGIRQDWAKAKERLGQKAKVCSSDKEFLLIVSEAIRCLRDAHMGLSQTKVPALDWPKRYYLGVSFMPATSNRVVVMAAAVHKERLPAGTVVTKIDGRDARVVLEEKAKEAWTADSPYQVSVSSPQRARLFAFRWPLLSPSNCTHTLHYLAGGQEQELQVTCDIEPRGWPHTYNPPASLTRADGSVSHALLGSGAGYMYLRSVSAGTPNGIQQALEAHPNAKGWILDLRGNGGGGYDTNLLDQLKRIPRPVVAIIDAGCISAGETLARDLVELAGARLIGSRTAGASSSKRQWQFPSAIGTVTFSTRSRWRGDGQPIEFNGITPVEEIEAVPEEVQRG